MRSRGSSRCGTCCAIRRRRRSCWRRWTSVRGRWWSWRPAAVLAMAGMAAVAVVVGPQKAPAPAELVAKVEMPAAPAPVRRRSDRTGSGGDGAEAGGSAEVTEAGSGRSRRSRRRRSPMRPKVEAMKAGSSGAPGARPRSRHGGRHRCQPDVASGPPMRRIQLSPSRRRPPVRCSSAQRATPERVQPSPAQAVCRSALGLRYSIEQTGGPGAGRCGSRRISTAFCRSTARRRFR